MGSARLGEAWLNGADLRGADLESADLRRAKLMNAKLQEVNLFMTTLTGISMNNAWLDRTRLRRDQIGPRIGEELDHQYLAAKEAYHTLKLNFESLADADASTWAYLKGRQMGRMMHAPWRAREYFGVSELVDSVDEGGTYAILPFWHPRVGWLYLRHTVQWVTHWLIELSCGYGESAGRTLASLLLAMAAFGLTYWLSNGITIQNESSPMWSDYLVFTFGVLTNSVPRRFEVNSKTIEVLMAFQTFVGIVLTGLLGFVLGNRIRR